MYYFLILVGLMEFEASRTVEFVSALLQEGIKREGIVALLNGMEKEGHPHQILIRAIVHGLNNEIYSGNTLNRTNQPQQQPLYL